MINKQRIGTILNLALPVTVGLSSSFVMAMIDLAMVARVGTVAVAAVGLAGFSYALIAAFLSGMTPAVQGMVSRRLGQGSTEPKCLPLNGGLLLALVVGIPVSLLCWHLAPWYFSRISPDPDVARQGVSYLRALLIGLTATGLDNAFQGHWAGVGRTRVYMFNVIFVNILHVALNYVFIFGHFGVAPMGATGAGFASTISVFVSMAIYLVVTFVGYRHEGFLAAPPDRKLVGSMLQIGVPAMAEAGFFALGFVVFYWIVGNIGTPELAATNVLVRISILMDLFAQALGMAAITLVSRSLGEGDPEGAAQWGWDVGKLAVFWITLLGAPLVVFPHACLSVFLSDPATLEMAIVPAQLTGAFLGVASLIYIFASTLISLGDGKRVMLVSFSTQWILFLPGVWVVGVMMRGGLLGITLVQLAYGALATTLIVAIWRDGRWKRIKI